MEKNLDIWAIQNIPTELDLAINNIKQDSKYNILYCNCACNFTVGNTFLTSKNFDTMFYSEDSDMLILLQKEGIVSSKDLKEKLSARGIQYTNFDLGNLSDTTLLETVNKEIWFARDKSTLLEALQDSKEKGINRTIYYPNVQSSIQMGYIDANCELVELEGRCMQGVIDLEDKMILIILEKGKNGIREIDVYNYLIHTPMMTNVDVSTEVKSLNRRVK